MIERENSGKTVFTDRKRSIACIDKMRINVFNENMMLTKCFVGMKESTKTTIHTLLLQLLRLSYHVRKIAHYTNIVFVWMCVLGDIFYRILTNWGITLKLWIIWMNLNMFKMGHMCFNCMNSAATIHSQALSHVRWTLNMKPICKHASLLA